MNFHFARKLTTRIALWGILSMSLCWGQPKHPQRCEVCCPPTGCFNGPIYKYTLQYHSSNNNSLYAKVIPPKANLEDSIYDMGALLVQLENSGQIHAFQKTFLENLGVTPTVAGAASALVPYGNNIPQPAFTAELGSVPETAKQAMIAYVEEYGLPAFWNEWEQTLQAAINGDENRVRQLGDEYVKFATSKGILVPPNEAGAKLLFEGMSYAGGIMMAIPGAELWGLIFITAGFLGDVYLTQCPAGGCQ